MRKVLVEGQKIEVKWNGFTRRHYESKGYVFTKDRESFYVDPEDLTDGSGKKVKLVCDYCKKEYSVPWSSYKKQKTGEKDACPRCHGKKRAEMDLAERQEILYNRAKNICGKNGYKLISTKEEITGVSYKVKYECPVHGIKTMSIDNLTRGRRCPDCKAEKARDRYQLSPEEVIKRVEEYGGTLLNPFDYINLFTKNLKMVCPECQTVFETSLNSFCHIGGQVCPNCSGKESSGERKIRKYLEANHINYCQEHWFADCKDTKPLPFDFYLPDYNILIECDGPQHHKYTGWFPEEVFHKTQEHDQMKNNYCKEKNINLIRIPSWKTRDINKVMNKELEPYVKDIV